MGKLVLPYDQKDGLYSLTLPSVMVACHPAHVRSIEPRLNAKRS